MRFKPRSLIFSAVLSVSAAAALADTYNFTISTGSTTSTPGTTFNVSGILTGHPDPSDPSAIILDGVTGAGQGYAFTGIVPLGGQHGFLFDNVLYTNPTATHVDSEGVLLYLSSAAGISLAHTYVNGGYRVDVFDPHDPGDVTPFAIDTFTISPAAIPEPQTLLLLGTGILSLAAAAKRKFART
jgi:PEP-CTERM motif